MYFRKGTSQPNDDSEKEGRLEKLEQRIKNMQEIISDNINKVNAHTIGTFNQIKRDFQFKIQKQSIQIKQKFEELRKNNQEQRRNIQIKLYEAHQQTQKSFDDQIIQQKIQSLKIEIPNTSKNLERVDKLQQEIQLCKRQLDQWICRTRPILQSKEIQFLLEQGKNKEKKELEKIRIDKMKKKISESPIQLVNDATPLAKNFQIQKNTITLRTECVRSNGEKELQQILLNFPIKKSSIFTLQTTIKQFHGLAIGIVDLRTQKQQKSSLQTGNAICYHGYPGKIFYGQSNQEGCKLINGVESFESGIDVLMEVNMPQSTITYTLKFRPPKTKIYGIFGSTRESKIYSVQTNILSQLGREFVPYFQMLGKGTCITWKFL